MGEIIIKLVNGELAGQTAQTISKEYNAAALAAKKATVGTQEWVNAHARLDKAKGMQADLKKQIDSTTKASDSLKGSFMGILNQIPGFQSVTSALGGMKGGVGGLTSGFGVLRGAIIATGLGALLIIIVSLISYFTKTEKGANMIGGAFKALGAIVDTLLNRLWNIQETLKQFLTNPLKFFKDLGNDIADAAVEAYDLVQLFDELEDKKRDLELTNAQTESAVDRLLLQSRNVALSFKERMALLEQASQLEKEQFQARVQYANEYLLAVGREAAAAEKNGVMNDELADKLQTARIDVINLDKESIPLQEKIANRRSQLVEKEEGEIERIRKAKEKQAQDEMKALQNIEDLRVRIMDEGFQKEVARIELDTQRKIDALIGSAAQINEATLLLETEKQIAIAELTDKFMAEQAAKREKERLAQADLELQLSTNEINERYLINEITEQQFRELSIQNLISHQQRKLDILRASHGEESIEYQRAYGELLAMQKSSADAQIETTKQITKEQAQAFDTSLSVFGNVFGAMAGMHEQGTQKWKDMATAQAIISTIQGGINAYSSTAAIPLIGPALAPVAAALAVAAGYASVKKIQSTKVTSAIPKKELGGYLNGPRHSEGGIPIEAEGGEFIFSRKAVQALGVGHLTQVNDHFTRRFATGGPVNPFSERSTVGASRGSFAPPAAASSNLEKKIDVMISILQEWPTKLKTYVVAREVDNALKTEAKIKNDADF